MPRPSPLQLILDVAMAAGYTLVALPFELSVNRQGPLGIAGPVLIVVGFAVALGGRRVAPGWALGVAWVAAFVQMALNRPPNVSDLAILVILYTTAAHGSRRVSWFGFASAILGAIAITVYLFVVRTPSAVGSEWDRITSASAILLASLFGLLLAWTLGTLARIARDARETRLAQQRAEAEAIAEQQRVRIARDMHDVVAHSLAVVVAQADGARYASATEPDVATEALATISATARSALADVRLLLAQLRHSEDDGPQPRLADLGDLYDQVRAAGVPLEVDDQPAPATELPAPIQLAVYRIVQEALTNALRHGRTGPEPVRLRLGWRPDRVEIEVRNPSGPTSATTGHGLIGMRERAQLVGGSLSAGPRGGEFAVEASLPLPAPAIPAELR